MDGGSPPAVTDPGAVGGGAPPHGPPPPAASASVHGGPPAGPQPPSMGPAPSEPGGGNAVVAPTAQRTPGNRLVGQVDGKINVAFESRGLRGVRVLVIAAVLALVLLTAKWALSTQADLPQLLSELTVALLVVAGLFALLNWGFGISPAALLRAFEEDDNAGSARTRLCQLRGRDPGWPRTSVAVVRVRLRGMTGELVSCVMRGASDGEIRSGDYLLVEGRRRRKGEVVVRRAEVLQGPAGPQLRVVESRPAPRSVAVTVGDWLCLAAGLALFLWVVIDLFGR